LASFSSVIDLSFSLGPTDTSTGPAPQAANRDLSQARLAIDTQVQYPWFV
jgi:hypothetical protein